VKVAGSAGGVAGAADVADDVAGVNLVSLLEGRGPRDVRVLVPAALAEPADDDEVAVEAGSNARFTTVPARTAASGVPQRAVTSKPMWTRPPLRAAPNSPTGARVPCGPRTGKKWP
jgi:hypothetical protein